MGGIMLEDINETQTTMQADEVDEVVTKNTLTSLPPAEMTFKEQPSEVKEEPLVDNSRDSENDPLKGINLEDDIEKVEVTSQESSEENEEGCESPKSEREHPIFSIPTQNPSESIKNWLQRITDMQNELHKKYSTTVGVSQASSHTTNVSSTSISSTNAPSTTSIPPNRVVKYQDLPYMGEITLDNSKPRRGRKPKKADICHLIYKNYGTIFPGTPNPGSYLEKDTKKSAPAENKEAHDKDNGNRIDVQNKIISSLLEKRLTQEYNRSKEAKRNSAKDSIDQNEPLNLCIRDLNHLKIRLLKNTDNTYTSQIKSEPLSDEESDCPQETPSPASSSRTDARSLPAATPDSFPPPSPDAIRLPDGAAAPGGYVYWPNAGVFIHPVALQQQLMMYQRMTNGSSYVLPSNHSPKPPPEKGEPGSGVELRKLVPKIAKPRPIFSKENIEQTDQHGQYQHDMKKRNASSSEAKIPVKRKRSAIFIPPIPTENNTNPATEVSICKFKFTGGAKPSLQEKKMLSVDSGGNFRYYSGTGDKSMRGYEFFPRETLQQQISNTQGSSTGAFLQASGEKIYPVPPPGFTGTKNGADFLLSPNIPVPGFSKSQDRAAAPDSTQKVKKRKSRKSLQREKLEQTFKEKGFLIQTQQTESAEGATYCKFRQLRKFTRYLFRSWKDYLPGNITEGEQPVIASADGNGEMNINQLSRDSGDSLSRHSSELTASNAQ